MKWLRFTLIAMACALAINSTVSAEAELTSSKADMQRDLSTLPEWEMIASQREYLQIWFLQRYRDQDHLAPHHKHSHILNIPILPFVTTP